MQRFGLSDVQAQAILDMRLKALQGLDRERLQNEYNELEAKIAYYKELLADPEKIKGVLKTELCDIRDRYGDERKTEIQDLEDEIDIEDLIDEEDCVYTLTHNGYIKRLPASEYKAQGRGGKGVRAMSTRDEDFVETVFTASTHDNILFFTNLGKVYVRKGYRIPEAGRTARGSNIVNIIPIEPGEKVSAMIAGRGIDEESFLMFVTRRGTVKRTAQSLFKNIRSNGIRALSLDEGDELMTVLQTDGGCKIIIATKDGMSVCFDENDVRSMGRDAVGVRGIRLREGDLVVGAGIAAEGSTLLSITENGYGKRTEVSEYSVQNRGGMGVKNYNVTEKTGLVADVKVVTGQEDLLVISNDGTMIRMDVGSISVLGRSTQGVRVMRLGGETKVISVATAEKDEADAEAEAEQ